MVDNGGAPVAGAPVQRQPPAADQQQQLAILHNMNIRIGNLEEKVDASHGDLKQELQQQQSHVNRNMSRLQVLAPSQRAATGGNVGPVCPTAAQLGRLKCLHTL